MESNRRGLLGKWLLILSGIVSLLMALWFYPRVFPISGLRLQLSRTEAAERATRFLQQMEVQIPPGYTRATRFAINSAAKSYLEQQLGIARANQVAQSEGFVYFWHTRWFRPSSERELFVAIDPEGRVLSFSDRLPTDAPAPPSRQPRRVAERFVSEILGVDLRAYRLMGEYQASHPNRVDYTYVWERTDLRLAEATQRIGVTVTGDRVIYFMRYLHFPESFTHTFRLHRSRGDLIVLTANVVTALVAVVLVVVLLFGAAQRQIRWRVGLAPAALVTVVYLLNYLNGIPLQIAAMEADQTWGAFWLRTVTATLLGSLVAGVQVLLIIAAADRVYRQAFPQAVPLQHWWTRRGWAHPEGRKRVALGYWLFAIHLLYIVLFLAAARRLMGAWASSIVPYDDLLSTAAPWAYPMLVAIEAAVLEEFLFRVFLISLFARYARSVWAGILVSAVLWSALHCSYPTVPYYLRAVELIPVGIVEGWFVARFGPLPSLISHALYNAAVSSDVFLYNTEWLPRLSFGVVLLFLLLPAALAWRWSRQPGADSPLTPATNAAVDISLPVAEQPAPPAEVLPEREVVFPTLGRRRLWYALLALGVVLGMGFGWYALQEGQKRFDWKVPPPRFPRGTQLDSQQAIQVARQYLPRRGEEVRGWRVAAKQLDSERGEDYEYLRRFLSRADADALWARLRAPDGVWAVRWWKPGTREEWWVLLTAEGGFWERYCQLPEEAPGERIDRERAQAIATQTLRDLGFPLHRMRLFDSSSHQFPARSFHRFTWQMEGVRVGQAQFHLVVDVEGDVAANILREVNAPSSYRFQQQRTTIWQAAGAILTAGVFLVLVIWSWRVHVRLMRQPGIPWKAMLLPAGVVSVLPPLLFLLNLRAHLYSAPTTLPPQAWLLGVAAATLALSAVLFVGLWQMAPYIPAWRNAFPDLPDPLQWWRALTRPRAHRRVWREAIVAQAAVWAGVGVVAILGDLVELLALPGGGNVAIPEWLVQWEMSSPLTAQSILAYSPLLYSLVAALLVGVLAFWLWIGLVAGARAMFTGWRQVARWYLLLLVPATLLLDEGWERAQYLLGVIALFGVLWGLYRTILRWNPLTLFVAGAFATLLVEGTALLHYARHRQEGLALWLVVAAVLLWAWWDGRREHREARSGLQGS